MISPELYRSVSARCHQIVLPVLSQNSCAPLFSCSPTSSQYLYWKRKTHQTHQTHPYHFSINTVMFGSDTYVILRFPWVWHRLLRLMLYKDETAPIQCQLFDYSLQDRAKPSIRAYPMYRVVRQASVHLIKLRINKL